MINVYTQKSRRWKNVYYWNAGSMHICRVMAHFKFGAKKVNIWVNLVQIILETAAKSGSMQDISKKYIVYMGFHWELSRNVTMFACQW